MNCKVNHAVSFFCVLLLTAGAGAAEPGLVGWWKLDEGVGTTVADSSDRGHGGSFVAGNPAWVEGKYGGALKFDGVSKVEIPDHADFHLEDAVSVALWANPEAVQVEDAKLFIKQKSGYYPYCLQYDGNSQTIYANINASAQFNTRPRLPNFPGQWAHLCFTYDGSALILYKDGVEVARVAASGKLQQNTLSLSIGGRLGSGNNFKGMIDDVRLYNRALTWQEILQVMQGPPAEPVSKPSPATGAADVPRDVTLHWTPRESSSLHDIYFGTVPADIDTAARANPNGVLVSQAQDVNTYDPASLLVLGQTYYWRVDEVNVTTGTISKGIVWSFTTEPVGYAVKSVAATASSSQSADTGPDKTIDGSGLDASDRHSTLDTTMWLSSIDGPQPAWIQYEFDRVYKLHQMWVWNSNQPVEPTVGFGAKDVIIEYSADGDTWTALPGLSQFARATGKGDYIHNTTVDFGGVAAKYVKITTKTNWGGFLPQYGLSEVRFFQIPVRAREPLPASAATGLDPDTVLRWRAGREAVSHQVYFGTDANAVAAATTPTDVVGENSYSPTSLGFGSTYYWRIDEVNQAADPSLWKGDLWSFSTTQFSVVDDMEKYTNDSPNRVFQTWIDGGGFSPDGFFPSGNPGNGTGALVGYDPLAGSIMETKITHGGKQSMPLAYDNSGSVACSEAERTWSSPQDWTANGADTLRLFFEGRPIGFEERSPSNITMSGIGADIFNTADEGRFVYEQLNGDGWIIARVDSLVDTDPWAKAGVMIRRSADAATSYAYVFLSGSNGVRFQARTVISGSATSDSTVATPAQMALVEPVWVKVERVGTAFNGYYSTDNKVWTPMIWNPQTIAMGDAVCIGLAVTSHAATAITTAEFSNVSASSNVTGPWTSVDLGVPQLSNTPDQLYVTIKDASGRTRTVLADVDAVLKGTWQPWSISLNSFTGVNMSQVKSMIIGVGDRANPEHGTGMLFIDDIGIGHPTQ